MTSLRDDLDALLRAQAAKLDPARPAAVERQRQRGRWTVREVVDALADPNTFVEYGGLDKASAGKAEDYYTNSYLP